MNWSAIDSFVLVAELGHLSQAAERLFISQPALSRQIRKLEESLGFDLFKRQGRRMNLSPEGQMFLEEARELLGTLNQTNEVIQQIRSGHRVAVRIGASSVVIRYVITPALVAFSKVEPETEVIFYEADNDVQGLLRDGRAELIICGKFPDRKNLTWQHLYSFHICALMAYSHPLSTRTHLDMDDLLDEQLLLLSTGKASQLLYSNVVNGVRPRRVMESNNPETLLTLAEGGLGIALVTDTIALGEHTLTAVPFFQDGTHAGSATYAAWPRGRSISSSALRFLDFVRRERGYAPSQADPPALVAT